MDLNVCTFEGPAEQGRVHAADSSAFAREVLGSRAETLESERVRLVALDEEVTTPVSQRLFRCEV